MPRLFTAIDIPQALKVKLSGFQAGLQGARWVDPSDFHVTLCFIGDVSVNDANLLVEALAEIKFEPQDLVLTELSFFGSVKPRSLHFRIKNVLYLERLVKKQERILENLGLKVEVRGFLPHITLANFQRGVTPFEVTQWIEVQAPLRASFKADCFSLYKGKDGGGAPYVKIIDFC